MKHILIAIKVVFTILIFSNCVRHSNKVHNSTKVIDIESNINNFREISLGDLNIDICYVPLQIAPGMEIERIDRIDFANGLILVSNDNLCLLFDNEGKLLTNIGKKGRGPDEYPYISNTSFGFNNNIFLQSSGNFLEFDINGTFIKSFDIKKGKSPLFYMISWIPLTDSLFFGQVPLSAGNEKSKAIIFDIYGNTRREYPNYIILNRSTVNFTSDDSEANFYSYSDTIYYKEKLNDTLFFLTRNYELSSRISFRIGKYKIPVSLRETIDVDGCNPNNYVYVNKIFETSNFLLIGCEFGKYTLHKRITPRIVMGKEIWVNTTDVLGFYSKMNGTLIFCKPSCTDNPIITTGIRNDIDVGPWFYPLKQVNDSTLVMWVEAKQLIDHVESNDFKNDEAMCPEKKKELEVLTNKLSAFDNPILMFVTFHKDDE